jgi:hypothetical protein
LWDVPTGSSAVKRIIDPGYNTSHRCNTLSAIVRKL